jgi:hypothetical protein
MPDGSLVIYDDRFKLEVVAYSTQYVDDDGVIEPGELGVVTSFLIKNAGLMPTPTQSEIFASLETNTWVTMKTETLMPNKILIAQ